MGLLQVSGGRFVLTMVGALFLGAIEFRHIKK
jgi:hypothetical protein